MAKLINSADGELDISIAWGYSKEEILEFLDKIAQDPLHYGIEEDEVKASSPAIKQAVSNVRELSNIAGNHDPDLQFVEVHFDGAKLILDTMFDCLGWILSITAHPAKTDVSLTEEEFFFPLLGLYGKWIQVLAIRKTPGLKNGVLTNEDFPGMIHISYWLDVKTKALRTLLGSTPGRGAPHPLQGLSKKQQEAKDKVEEKRMKQLEKDLAGMKKAGKTAAEIKKFKDKSDAKAAAVPDPAPELESNSSSSRSHLVIRDRQKQLQLLGFKPRGVRNGIPYNFKDELVDASQNGDEGDTGFGRCAETYFYIWAGTYIKDKGEARLPEVHGLALKPKEFNSDPIYDTKTPTKIIRFTPHADPSPRFDQAEVKAALADPCLPSCQEIMLRQMSKNWGWEPKFMIAKAPSSDALQPGGGPGLDDDDNDLDEDDPKGKGPRKPDTKKGPKGPSKNGKGPDSKKPPSKGGSTITTERGPRSKDRKNGGKPKGQVPPKPLERSFIASVPAEEEEELVSDEADLETIPDKETPADEDIEVVTDEGDEISDEGDEMPDEGDEIPDEGDEIPDEDDEIPDESGGIPDEGDEIPEEQSIEEIPVEDEGVEAPNDDDLEDGEDIEQPKNDVDIEPVPDEDEIVEISDVEDEVPEEEVETGEILDDEEDGTFEEDTVNNETIEEEDVETPDVEDLEEIPDEEPLVEKKVKRTSQR